MKKGIAIVGVVINMNNNGLTAEQIVAVTDLDIEAVEAIIRGKK